MIQRKTEAVPGHRAIDLAKSVPLPEQFLVGMAIGACLHRLRPWRLPLPPRAQRLIGRSMTAAGAGIMVAGWQARGWWNDLEHPDVLVRAGAYRYSRNPMYVGMALVHLGTALALRSAWIAVTWLPAAAAIDRDIRGEEAALADQFGDEFERYRVAVPRYLGPVRRRTESRMD